jgi:hypothetical protein
MPWVQHECRVPGEHPKHDLINVLVWSYGMSQHVYHASLTDGIAASVYTLGRQHNINATLSEAGDTAGSM